MLHPVLTPCQPDDYLRASTTGVCKMSATTGYRPAYNALLSAYDEAVTKGLVVSQSNRSFRKAYGWLTMTRDQVHDPAYRTEFKRYDSHLRRVNACLKAIESLNSSEVNAARNALNTLRAAMQKAFFKMFDYDNNDYIDVNEMTTFLTHRFKGLYDTDTEQRMGVTYQALAELTAQQAFFEAHLHRQDSMSLAEFNAWYETSDGATIFLKAGGRFGQRPSWLEERLEVLRNGREPMTMLRPLRW